MHLSGCAQAFGKLKLRAFERYMELAKRTTGGDATRQKVKVGEEEDMVDSETTSVLGSAREVPNEVDR